MTGPPGWRSGLHLGSSPGSVAASRRRSVGRRTIGLASSGLGWVWPVGISLSHRAPATPVAGRAQCALTKVHGVSSTTVVWLDGRCVKKQCGLVVFRMTHGFLSCSDETRQ